MDLNLNQYNRPGIYTTAVPGPQLGVSNAPQASLAIFGDSARKTNNSEVVTLTDTTAVTLSKSGIFEDSIVVADRSTGVLYAKDTDYVLTKVANQATSTDDQYTIKRKDADSDIVSGGQVIVSYSYADESYFRPNTFFDYDDVRDFYGDPLDENGNIVSELTMAAYIAFQNGVGKVVCSAVNASGAIATNQEYIEALNRLSDESSVSVVVSANGQSTLHSNILSHVNTNSNAQRERRAVLGFDGSVTAIAQDVAIAAAQAVKSHRVALVYPDRVKFFNPVSGVEQVIGGHWMAVAVGALAVAQTPALPLTRKQIIGGFTGLVSQASESNRAIQAQGGLMVIEEPSQGRFTIMHGVTTDPTSLVKKEWTITGQEDAMAKTVRNFVDANGHIGSVITEDSDVSVRGTVSAALEQLKANGIIRDYRNLKSRQLQSPADVVEVRCEWAPFIPLNYLVFKYSLNLTTSESTTETTAG